MADSIERTSPVPYYEQLFMILRDRIVSGAVETDARLPSELELARDFGLSRATVRQTMSRLESEGLARRVARRGMFAAAQDAPTGWTVQEGFLESQVRQGRTGVTTEVVSAGAVRPPHHVRDALRLSAAEETFALERVRSMNGRRAMFSTNWFPPSVGEILASAEDVLDGTASVNDTLRRHGLVASGARRVIRALGAPASVAEHLEIDPGTPIMRVRSLSWDSNDVRFDYYETWVLTDVIPLEVNVSAS
ncbi:GntR family transcriptional regulator [Microbacterium sp. LMI1-1-1.1]|uniref:GntR family transcriptional regulator n=1 Tax=Microbacterium sp. LMI1-1-1.1 TaxID=3135223 RepID=UPI0034667334